MANIIFYDQKGKAISTTFSVQNADPSFASTLNITEDIYEKVEKSEGLIHGENIEIDGRWYRLARGVLKVADTQLGLFAVSLPLNFVIETGSVSRNTYVFLFAIAMIVVILIGYYISRMIITPLSSLINTSQAISSGDLTKRTEIQSKDEIGVLAQAFDKMTERLQSRTTELEKTNKMLEQMDQTKANFIQISAHELRTPLTLVNGYAQMLKMKAADDADLDTLAQGILDGYDRMASIVGNMLDLSKIDNRTMEVSLGSVQIGLLIMQLQKEFQSPLKKRNLTLSAEGLGSLPLLKGDPALLAKAFYHLIINLSYV
ncbi:MAG: HAMP domain-containing histidine kinase [Chloroflexi bacterium]|nr:HAMP domain-containing histidine kinase [Chloroflexota bacterium]